MAPPREQTPGHGRSVGPGPGAPTDELHGREPQVPVGAAQVRRGLHEELPVVTKAALHLWRRRRGWLPASALAPSEAPASPAAPGPERTAVTRPGVGGSAGPRPFFPPRLKGAFAAPSQRPCRKPPPPPAPCRGPLRPQLRQGVRGPSEPLGCRAVTGAPWHAGQAATAGLALSPGSVQESRAQLGTAGPRGEPCLGGGTGRTGRAGSSPCGPVL